jgi:hypothetical protein
VSRDADYINAYLVAAPNVIVDRSPTMMGEKSEMPRGNMPYDGGNLLLSFSDLPALGLSEADQSRLVRRIYGSAEFIRGLERYCLWIERDEDLQIALQYPAIADRIEAVRKMRLASRDKAANDLASRPHQFREMNRAKHCTLAMPRVSSESREFLPVGLLREGAVVTDLAYALYDAPLWNLAIIASKLHLVWIATVCGQLETRIRYSNTIGWNTFPLPKLTEQNKADLTACAENILLAREAHFPATIADLYDPETMPENLRRAHEENDETLERI